LNIRLGRRSTGMLPDANVRDSAPFDGGRVVPLFPDARPTSGRLSCPECGRPIQTRKPASVCSPRCRASASRRRRVEAALLKLDAAQAGLMAALEVVQQLRAVLVFRGAP
jgi:predicted nucleic acid-binding Zn ribbon protein